MKLTTEKFQQILRLQKKVEHQKNENQPFGENQKIRFDWSSEHEQALYDYWDGLEELERQELVAMKWMGEMEEPPEEFPALVTEARMHTNIAELHKSKLSEYWEKAWETLHDA
ncbi:MAG: DUF3775 domain-containing protein [Verrucomicrobia bacterium]|nr:DUF3775 domain-containing protein [Verrucomicrobiota bacterium]MCH8511145.1 DUF3775 domain-containing protein [Kiritimatiellia bacterium]